MRSVEYYVSLLEDRPRISAALSAIAADVRPGDRVVEIGCGIGTYTLAALKAGAAHVTAIDSNPTALALARELGVVRTGGSRLTLIEGPAQSVRLDPRADVVIFEDYGGSGHSPGLRSLLEHVRLHLAAPNARYIPRGVDLLLAPVDRELRPIGPGDAGGLPFDAEALALLRKRSLNDPFCPDLGMDALSAPGQLVGRLVPGQDLSPRVSMKGEVRMARPGRLHGLLGWIRLDFGQGGRIEQPPAAVAPTYPPLAFPFEDPLEVAEGERLELTLEAIYGPGPQTLLWQWGATGTRGRRGGNSANGMPGDLELLRRGSPQEIPRPHPGLAAALEACRRIDGTNSSAEIGRIVYSLYKGEFPDERAATAFVLDLLNRLRGIAPS
ncbi:MAG TPA: class I SAM-dependent methyltransferase [Planctomycetota bacterium]|nr:class I SAM-dependent methyltransferase [Planctomycetota bacterium]